MRKNVIIVLFVFIPLFVLLPACGSSTAEKGDDTSPSPEKPYEFGSLPETFSIKRPDSVASEPEIVAVVDVDTSMSAGGTVAEPQVVDNVSDGYIYIKKFVNYIQSGVTDEMMDLILVDALYQQIVDYMNGNGVTSIPAGVLSGTYTQEMANKASDIIIGSYPDTIDEKGMDDIRNKQNESAGTQFTNNNIISANLNSPDLTDADGDGYHYTITFSKFDNSLFDNYLELISEVEDDDSNNDYTISDCISEIKWNADKTRTSLKKTYSMEHEDGIYAGEFSVIYDASGPSAVMYVDTTITMTPNNGDQITKTHRRAKIEKTGDNNGIRLHSYFTSIVYRASVIQSKSQYLFDGIIDDDGGYLQYSYWTIFDSYNYQYKYRELFKDEGELAGRIEYDFTDKLWQVTGGFTDPGYGYNNIFEFDLDVTKLNISGITATTLFYILPKNTVYNPSDPVAFEELVLGSGGYNAADTSQNFVNFYGYREQLDGAGLFAYQKATETSPASYTLIEGASLSF